MSNKQQLQTNNTKYASLIETLRGKAIPSGSEDLDTELTTQENLISQLSTILDSKASGGGSDGEGIPTCTVKITIDASDELMILVYMHVQNDKVVPIYTDYGANPITNTELTLNNIVCGSILYLSEHGAMTPNVILSDNMSYINVNTHSIFWLQAPSSNGDVGTVFLYDDD